MVCLHLLESFLSHEVEFSESLTLKQTTCGFCNLHSGAHNNNNELFYLGQTFLTSSICPVISEMSNFKANYFIFEKKKTSVAV